MWTDDKSILEITQANLKTQKGADLTLAGVFFPHTKDSLEMGIIAHIKNKYDILSSIYGFSADEKEILDTLSFVENDQEFAEGSDPIVGRTMGFIYPKPSFSANVKHSKEDIEKLAELKKDLPEYFLSLIKVKEGYRDFGIGSFMLRYAEYKFAKELHKTNKKQGFIEGHFSPLDDTKHTETEQFYRNHGFELYDTELFKPVNVEQTLEENYEIFEGR